MPLAPWAVATAVVLAGLSLAGTVAGPEPARFSTVLEHIDGEWYADIAENGYHYTPGEQSAVAFFPLFPLLGRWCARATGWPAVVALAFVSNGLGCAAACLAWAYLRRRSNGDDPGGDRYALLLMCLSPFAFFHHLAYSESTFLLLELAVLGLIVLRRPAWVVAVVAGLGSAARPVGLALAVPTCLYLWDRSARAKRFAARAAVVLPTASWGLLAYMAYQRARFGTALAFVRTQADYRTRPPAPLGERVLSLLSWEPVRQAFDPLSTGYWRATPPVSSPWFNVAVANPVAFVVSVVLIGVGVATRWLTRYELAVAVPLLAVPYVTRAYEMQMASQARFASVVFPVYIVAGRLLARLPPVAAVAVMAGSACALGAYATLYAAGYPLL